MVGLETKVRCGKCGKQEYVLYKNRSHTMEGEYKYNHHVWYMPRLRRPNAQANRCPSCFPSEQYSNYQLIKRLRSIAR